VVVNTDKKIYHYKKANNNLLGDGERLEVISTVGDVLKEIIQTAGITANMDQIDVKMHGVLI
jgi:hypothetical protein